MSVLSSTYGLKTGLQKKIFAIAAFLTPLLIRSIPEILSWPSPLGFDTVVYYIPLIREGWVFSLSLTGFMKTTSLFYLLSSLPYELTHNSIAVIKVLGILLLSVLCFTFYVYARKALRWTERKSFLIAVLTSIYFVSLRNSWDMYRQTLGLIFLVTALLALKSSSSPRRYYAAAVLMVLTVLSHELAAVILFSFVAIEASRFLIEKSRKEFLLLSVSAILPIGLFFFQVYSFEEGTLLIPSGPVASNPSLGLVLYMVGLILFCYSIILPLAFIGLFKVRDSLFRCWTMLCIGIILFKMIYPNAPTAFWFRWVLLLVYPLLFFTVEGLDAIWQFSSKSSRKIRRLAPKFFAIGCILSVLILSGFYLTTRPRECVSLFLRV